MALSLKPLQPFAAGASGIAIGQPLDADAARAIEEGVGADGRGRGLGWP